MNIHIYTDIATLFGKACRLWMDVLVDAGHAVEYVDLGMGEDGPLPDVGPSDVNILVCGIYAFARFGKQGLPRQGRNILWMLDPLTTDPQATVHGHKALLFDGFARELDAVMAMDAPIEAYVARHYPAVALSRLPYMVAEKNIRAPRPETARSGGVIFMGHPSPNRERAQQLFAQAGVPVDFVWRGLWGAEREQRLADARVVLAIHADAAHTYFDQFRTLEAWAAGTAVLAQDTGGDRGLVAHGVEAGRDLAVARLEDMPALCAELLRDAAAREQMADASRQLLREKFSPMVWKNRMLEVVEGARQISLEPRKG